METVFNTSELTGFADGGEGSGQLVKDESFAKEKEMEWGDPLQN